MWESRSRMISWPWRVWAGTETRLPCVPEETKRAASVPVRRAANSSCRRTVGSSSHTSSPTSARAIASRMAGGGRVGVSERRSTMSCMAKLPRGRRLDALARPPAPLRIGILVRELPEELLGLGGLSLARVDVGEAVEGFGDDEAPGIVLEHGLQALASGYGGVLVLHVIGGDPQLFLGETTPAHLDLGEGVGGIPAVGILAHQLLELLDGLDGRALVLLHRLHLVVVAHGEPVLHEVGDLVTRIEGHEGLELLDGLVEGAFTVVRLADEEARPRRVLRLRMPLHDLLEARARLRVVLLLHVLLALLIEILGGEEGLRLLAEHVLQIGAARYRERHCEGEVQRGAAEKCGGASQKGSQHQQGQSNWATVLRTESTKVKDVDSLGAAQYHRAMPLPKMYRVRQSFHRDRLADIPAGVRATMAAARLPINRAAPVPVRPRT